MYSGSLYSSSDPDTLSLLTSVIPSNATDDDVRLIPKTTANNTVESRTKTDNQKSNLFFLVFLTTTSSFASFITGSSLSKTGSTSNLLLRASLTGLEEIFDWINQT